MYVKDLIAELQKFDPEASISAVAMCRCFPFTLSWGRGGEGLPKEKAPHVSIYIDELNTSEQSNNFYAVRSKG
jgi:hypothetical protein